MSLEESIKANRERIAKRKSFGEEGRKRFEKEVGGPAFAHKAKSKALEGMKRGIHEIGRGHGVVKGPVGLKSYSDKNK